MLLVLLQPKFVSNFLLLEVKRTCTSLSPSDNQQPPGHAPTPPPHRYTLIRHGAIKTQFTASQPLTIGRSHFILCWLLYSQTETPSLPPCLSVRVNINALVEVWGRHWAGCVWGEGGADITLGTRKVAYCNEKICFSRSFNNLLNLCPSLSGGWRVVVTSNCF